MPSLYLGGLTFMLGPGPADDPARASVAGLVYRDCGGEPAGKPGPVHQPHLGGSRGCAGKSESAMARGSLANLGPIDTVDTKPIRADGYLRDGDGGFYWWLTDYLAGFSPVSVPGEAVHVHGARMAALAGLGWDRLCAGRAAGSGCYFWFFSFLTLATLGAVVMKRQSILAVVWRHKTGSRCLAHSSPPRHTKRFSGVWGNPRSCSARGLVLTIVARKRPWLAGSAALILMTADLAAANAALRRHCAPVAV